MASSWPPALGWAPVGGQKPLAGASCPGALSLGCYGQPGKHSPAVTNVVAPTWAWGGGMPSFSPHCCGSHQGWLQPHSAGLPVPGPWRQPQPSLSWLPPHTPWCVTWSWVAQRPAPTRTNSLVPAASPRCHQHGCAPSVRGSIGRQLFSILFWSTPVPRPEHAAAQVTAPARLSFAVVQKGAEQSTSLMGTGRSSGPACSQGSRSCGRVWDCS